MKRAMVPKPSEIETTRARLELALRAAGLAEWELDLRTGLMTLDARTHELLGLAQDVSANRASWLATMAAEDQALVLARLGALTLHDHNFVFEYRLSAPVDQGRWMRVSGTVFSDEASRPFRV